MLLISIITSQVYAAKLPFTDVPEKSWYYDDVKSAYESDLISGKKATKYAPNDNMTAAEAVKLAAAMYMLKNEGKVNFTSSKPWYKVYVDYAKQKSLIKVDLKWNKNITRAGYMQIFANILTDEEAKKNEVADGSIPDVPMTHPNAQAIYKLYRAGVVTGIDDKKNCAPASNIKRSEVAAILIRMMNPKRRLGFSLGKATTPGTGTTPPPGGTTVIEEKELKITKQPENVKGKVGETVRLEVMVDGGKQPYSYQWEYKNPKLPNFKNSIEKGNTTNVLEPPVESDVSFYRCVITDANGKKVTSNQARVDITTSANPLKITKQPQDVKGKVGEILRLEVMVDGGKQPYSYQWEYKNPKLPNFKNSIEKGNTTNVLEPPVESDISYYRCIITDADGDKVTSNTAKVEKKSSGVNIDDLIDPKVPLALKITKEPEDATGKVGETARLVVGVQGGRLPLRYQWQYTEYNYGKFQYTGIYQDSKAKGNTTAVLEPPIENDPCGYRCVITDADGYSVTSGMAEVKKKDDIEILPSPLKITRQPEKYKIVNDEPFEVSLDATVLPGTIKYQWQRRAGGVGGWVDLTPSSKY
ncbi:hypothetical protein HMPREF0379_2124, partial [[Eubacterium] yurii subsp. margaretiae ATCC 43715]